MIDLAAAVICGLCGTKTLYRNEDQSLDCTNCLSEWETEADYLAALNTQQPDEGEWTLDQLMKADLPKTKFFVNRMLPEGLSLIVSPAKVGKSFLVSSLALSIATGSDALGRIPTNRCEVLYLDLESNANKARERWSMLLNGAPVPKGIHLRYIWPRLGARGLERMEEMLDRNPKIGVIFVDVFSKIKPNSAVKGMNAYDQEYEILGRLKSFADERHIAICLVHHTNRSKSDDPLDTISGTNAMGGASDALWMLSRDRGKSFGKLYVTGRAAYESKYNLVWVPATGIWEIASQES